MIRLCFHWYQYTCPECSRYLYFQVYQSATDQYVCKDKFYGRSLKPFDITSLLYQYLYDGCELRVSLIKPIVNRLRKLRETLLQQDTFRFYSSSLLIMYDGSLDDQNDSGIHEGMPSSPDDSDLIDIRLIDFAHTTYKGFQNDRICHKGPDHGLILGLDNLIHMFLLLLKD